jgi:hypothetical protein
MHNSRNGANYGVKQLGEYYGCLDSAQVKRVCLLFRGTESGTLDRGLRWS